MNKIFNTKVHQQIWFCLFALLIPGSCKKTDNFHQPDPAFSKYIEAYTSGTISKTAAIRIRLASGVTTTHQIGEVAGKELFDFSPNVKGKTIWVDARTIEFQPEKSLEPGSLYSVTFHLDKLINTDPEFEKFQFSFKTVKPSFIVRSYGLRSKRERNIMYLPGLLETSDAENEKVVEKVLSARLNGKGINIQWEHSSDQKTHTFLIDNIKREDGEISLQLLWNGKAINAENEGFETIEVPAAGDFKVLQILSGNDARQYASVLFSSMVAVDQDLTGLITIENQTDISYTINGSEVKLYTGENFDGNYTINVTQGIKNIWGDTLRKGFTANVFFENRLPSVSIQGRGNILPNSGQLVLPFEATNLNAVDVSIIKIYENNIPQFLQTNNISGDDELRRVAIPVVQKTLRLDDDKTLDLRKKQRFSLDIDRFIKTEPGAIYRVTIGFRPEYSLYDCRYEKKAAENKDEEEEFEEYREVAYGLDNNDDFWNRYDDYYPFGYNWNQRNNPCARSYYNRDKWASRNIIASNIGLIAKRAEGNDITIAVADLLTTKPIPNIELQILDYQNQILASANSDNEGFAHFQLKNKPHLVVAKRENEKGYLRLDDGNSLPLSRFEVAGEEIKNGIKAFIFGERGVWRPGDTLFINCIVEDKTNKLPAGHPVELEFYDPRGMLFKKVIQANATDGYNIFRLKTEQNSPTGNWSVRIKIGGAVFEKRIKVETVMPNRLKVNLDFGANKILEKSATNTGILSANWLFGAPAKSLNAKIDASLYAKETAFPEFQGYTFYNPVTRWSPLSQTVYEGQLSAEGKAEIKPSFKDVQNAPGILTVNLLVKVFEPGGNFSTDNISIPFSPYKSYVGIKLPEAEKPWGFLLTGKQQQVQIANVNSTGNLISGIQEVEVQLYKIQWRWWWDNSSNDLSNFTQDRFNKLIKTENVKLNNGRGHWNFSVGEHEWGRYLVLVKDKQSGHVTGQIFYVDSPYWQSRDNLNDPGAAAMLTFTADKPKYSVGENITLTVPSSKGGKALISIESGSKVLETWWVDTDYKQTLVKLKATEEMAPNIYVNITLLQPHAQTVNDLPIRMYGVLPIAVEDKNTILKPVINIAKIIRPETPVSFSVTEQQGKEMSYSIAIVDEGLLDITRFKTPDPHGYFYAKEALGVRSWDLYDYVIGAWGSQLERILTIGGDNEGSGPGKPLQANRFKPVVKYLGPFHLNKNRKAKHSFTLPQYVGSVRVMVIAANDGSYGAAEQAVAVKKPLMMLATVPRVLAPGESMQVPVTIFAMDDKIKDVNVVMGTTPNLKNSQGNSRQIQFTGTGEQLIHFDVEVSPNTGLAKLSLQATAGNEKASFDVELDIRNPNPFISNVDAENLAAGTQWNSTATPIGTFNTSTAMLELSSIPAIDLDKRLDYLINYPHGCLEQITSSVFPQLVLNQLTDLPDYRKAEVDRNIRAGIAGIQNFQHVDGGFSYWPGGAFADEWGTNYAGHYLLEAKDRGFNVSEPMLQQWKLYERSKANAWFPNTTNFYGGDLTQAYRLYLLALAKAPEIGAMNRLREFKYISSEAKWKLAAAYKLVGQDNIALQLISSLTIDFSERKDPGMSYGSVTRDQAIALETLTLLGKRNQAFAVLQKIAGTLRDDTWLSTQTVGYSLVAIAKFCGKNPAGEKINSTLTVSGKTYNVNSKSYIYQLPVNVSKGATPVSVSNKGSNVLYARIITRGQPVAGESFQVKNSSSVLNMNIEYFDRNKKVIDISSLRQGTDFLAKVTVRNPGNRGNYERLALNQVFPSGWEIINTRLMENEGAYKNSVYEYQDIRDDRVYTYFHLNIKEFRTYYVQLNAAYLGRYYLPGTYCEAMYDHTITSGIPGKWVEVLTPQ